MLQEDLHDEAVKTVEAIKTASSAPWWLKIGATEEATQLMQEPAAYLASSIGLAGVVSAAHLSLWKPNSAIVSGYKLQLLQSESWTCLVCDC